MAFDMIYRRPEQRKRGKNIQKENIIGRKNGSGSQ
jgi:hypothetical protein